MVQTAITTVNRPTMPSLNGQMPQLFNARSYYPSEIFSASSSVPGLSDSAAESALKKIAEQRNACKVAIANQALKADLHKVEGASMAVSFEYGKNMLKREGYMMDLTFQADKLNIKQTTNKSLLEIEQKKAQVKVDRANAQLNHEQNKLNIDRQYYPKLEDVHRQKWDMRLDQMTEALGAAKALAGSTRDKLQVLEAELVA